MDKTKDVQTPEQGKVEEVKPKADTQVAETPTEVITPAEVEAPVSEVLRPTKSAEKDSVPLAVFLEEKKERKTLEKQISDLQKQVAAGKPVDISDEINALGEEYGVDAKFLAKLTNAIESKVKVGQAVPPEVTKLVEEHNARELDKAFKEHYEKAMAKMPEYAEVANPEVIKALSLLPENANKTFSQIIDETYNRSISGKRTIETTTPGGGKEPAPLDYQRAVKDGEYFKEVMGNPKLRAEYNQQMLKSGF